MHLKIMEKIKTFNCYQFATTKVIASSSPKDLTSEVPFLRLFSSIRIRNKEDLNLASYVKCGTIEIKGYHQVWHAWCGDLVTLSSTTDANLDWVFCFHICFHWSLRDWIKRICYFCRWHSGFCWKNCSTTLIYFLTCIIHGKLERHFLLKFRAGLTFTCMNANDPLNLSCPCIL